MGVLVMDTLQILYNACQNICSNIYNNENSSKFLLNYLIYMQTKGYD